MNACSRVRRVAGVRALAALLLSGAGLAPPCLAAPAADTADDPAQHVRFTQEPEGACISRGSMQVRVHNDHPGRTIRVWLDRYLMGTGTGDRSRLELKPGAEGLVLGCSRNAYGEQEWRAVRARWVD